MTKVNSSDIKTIEIEETKFIIPNCSIELMQGLENIIGKFVCSRCGFSTQLAKTGCKRQLMQLTALEKAINS